MTGKVVYDVAHVLEQWDIRVVLDQFLAGIGIGAIIFAVLIDNLYKGKKINIVKIGALIAPISTSLGLIILFTELGWPLRMIKVYTNFNQDSAFAWGGIIQPLFILSAILYALAKYSKINILFKNQKTLGIIGAVLGVVMAVYHGILLSSIAANPLWSDGPTVVAGILGFLLSGISLVVIISVLTGNKEEISSIIKFIRISSSVLLTGLLLVVIFGYTTLYNGSDEAVNAIKVMNNEYGILFWLVFVIIGLVIPLVLTSLSVKKDDKVQIKILVLNSVLILIGTFIYKYVLIFAGQLT